MLAFILSSILYEHNKATVTVLFFDLTDIYVYRYLVLIIVIFLR